MLGKNEIGMTGEESISKNAEGDRRRVRPLGMWRDEVEMLTAERKERERD